MSAIARIKAQVRAQRNIQRAGGNPNEYNHHNNETVVLPKKPLKKRKLMEVQKEAKESLNRIPGNSHTTHPKRKEEEQDDEEMEEDDDGYDNKPRYVPWGPASLLHNLNKPEVVSDIDNVIQLVKKKEIDAPLTDEEKRKGAKGEKKKEIIVWDHSKSALGKESDNNFFLWLEAYSAHEDKICQKQENMIFQ